MKTKNQKLDFFLHLAFMDQQLGLAVYKDEEELEQIRDFIGQQSGVSPFAARSLKELKYVPRGAYGIFYITPENRQELFSHLPTFSFPAGAKVIFVLPRAEFERMEDVSQTALLATFQPIFRPDL